MNASINLHHLRYFWVVAQEGGITRAAERLGMAVQTVSAQVRSLEQALGYALLKPDGRNLQLTEAGRAAKLVADQIFPLVAQLPAVVAEAATGQGARLRVGISDGLAKLVVRHLMDPLVKSPGTRLICHEDEFERLLADLALHRLDAVLSDRPAPANANLRLYSHHAGEAPLCWFAPSMLLQEAPSTQFPACLSDLPLLLPTAHAEVRTRIDDWLHQAHIKPNVVGEFEDSAMLATFARSGMGVFPASSWCKGDLLDQGGLVYLGESPELTESYHVISAQRRVQNPLLAAMIGRSSS